MAAIRELVAGASTDEQEKLFFRNAERIYRLEGDVRMKRYGSVIGLKPDAIAEYTRLHAAVWPDVLGQIARSNIRNYSIFLKEPENLLFSYFEYHGDDFAADMAAMAADQSGRRDWWAVCMPLQAPLDTRKPDEWWADMPEVFHVD